MINFTAMKKICSALLMLGISSLLQAQDVKQEFEKSIKAAQAPDRVRVFMDFFFPEVRKPDYYHESDGYDEYYEVKFRWREMPLSVEFYPNGQLMDIEQLVAFEELPDTLRQRIQDYFNAKHKRHHFSRIQVQFSGPTAINVIEGIRLKDYSRLTLRYEIEAEVAGGTDTPFGAYEYLFSETGRFIDRRPILKRSSDNVTY